jgi:hypothetical protein
MKKIFSILTFALAIMMVSCTKEGENTINEINDNYVTPANVAVLTTLAKSESTWSTDRRYFDLSFTGEGVSVVTTLVGYDALLTPGQYLIGADEIGKAIAAKTKLNDAAVQSGWITVTKKGDDYVFSFSLGGEVLAWTGALPFKADPAPVALTDVLSAQSNLGSGTNTLTINLAQTGLHQEMDPTTYQQTWVGEGKYLALDIYSEDGYLHDGNYLACAEGGKVNEGEFGIGWDPGDLYGIGWVFTDWGTCLWTVAGGVATAEKITEGLVKVSSEKVEDQVIWTISWGVNYPVELLFQGAIPALTKPEVAAEFDYIYEFGEPQPCILNDNTTVVEGVKKNPVTIMDADGKTVAYLEFVLADGSKELEGSFVSTEYAHEVGQLANGYYLDYSAYGFGIFEGGSYYIDADGNKVYIEPGKVVDVTKLVEGAYEFVGEGFDIKACGEGYVPGSYKDPNAAQAYTMTDTVAQDCTLEDGQTVVTTVESHTLTLMDGETFVAQIKLVRNVGATDLTGEYTVKEYAHEDMVAANGFDLGAMFGMGAGVWVIGSFYVKDSEIVIIEPGETITVTAEGSNGLKFVGSTGYTFVGQFE